MLKNKKGGMDLLSGLTGKLIIGIALLLVVGVSYLAISGKLQGMWIQIRNLFRFKGIG